MATLTLSPPGDTDVKMEFKPSLTPPASEEADKNYESSSELSDLEIDGDNNGEIVPDHYYEGGKIPVFTPTIDQFRSFKTFVQKIDKYGMKSGIVKVIPPKEWRQSLPALDQKVKTIKVKNPITQEFHGTHGTYTQANIEKQRSYNLPQWKELSEESNHQPPAKRGERRRNQEKITRGATTRGKKEPVALPNGKRRGPGRPRVRPLPTTVHKIEDHEEDSSFKVEVPPTPTSPAVRPMKLKKEVLSEDEELSSPKPRGRQPKSVSSRRKHNRRDQGEIVDEEAFKDFDYRVYNQDEWTAERCQELETAYWKSLTFNNPMYGADMPGSLFDDSTQDWNVAKLENLLDVLGQKVPGVNTAYLYLGMWKATFAWHLEDVDLYSINYIHFGAPKQWYSISQEDARRFEAAMRSVWPNDAKNCDQFLRHKTYLISPQLLQSQYNIKVNRLVHNEGEFVITFPYGYHSGYNLGYNCAESVNFATEAWLDYGRVAKKCNCEADSVWVDVGDIERKLRGEQTPEYYEETDDEDEEEDEDDDGPNDLPTPPGSDKGKLKPRSHKRKRDPAEGSAKPKIKRLRIMLKAPLREPCMLCPNDDPFETLLPTDNGQKAHRRCALYTPETYVAEENGSETVCDVTRIDKARLELKCIYCRNKRGAVFQCSQKKCTRAYHATCAAAGGVQVDIGIVPVFDEDGTEYYDTGIDFRCRFHRIKRAKNVDGNVLEENSLIRKFASKLSPRDVIQFQYLQSDIYGGVVIENRKSEQTLLVDILPKGDKVEVEYKWLLVFDRANSQLPRPSENAKPLPAHLARKSQTSAEDPKDDNPKADEPFCDPRGQHKWSEFHTTKIARNPAQVEIDILKLNTLWFYLGATSTEAKAQYTGDLADKKNNLAANFLESVRPASSAAPIIPRRSYPASYPTGINMHALNAARANVHVQQVQPQRLVEKSHNGKNAVPDKQYNGKYAIKDPLPPEYQSKAGCNVDSRSLGAQRAFQQAAQRQSSMQSSMPSSMQSSGTQNFRSPQSQMSCHAPMVSMMSGAQRRPSLQKSAGVEQDRRTPRTTYHQPPPQQKLYVPSKAPVANMMGSSSTGNRNPFYLPPVGQQQPKSSAPSVPSLRTRSSTLEALAKYPYLHVAQEARPPVYSSPYAAEGGFSEAWLPNPTAYRKSHSKSVSLSEDFLMKRTPSQQEHVKNYVQQMNAGKTLLREQKQRDQLRRQSLQRAAMPPPSLSLSHAQAQYVQTPVSLPTQNYQQQYHRQQPFTSPQSFNGSSQYSSYLYDNPPQNSLNAPLQRNHHLSSYTQPGLQFQSPQDFQLQMQREAQQQDWNKGLDNYEQMLNGLKTIGGSQAHGLGHPSNNAGVSSGGSGSPLRHGAMGAGGEMLPMMRDRF